MQNPQNDFYEHESRESGEFIILYQSEFFLTQNPQNQGIIFQKIFRGFRVFCVLLCYLSYFSNSEFFDLNSGTIFFISFTISGMFTSRLSFSSSFDASKAS